MSRAKTSQKRVQVHPQVVGKGNACCPQRAALAQTLCWRRCEDTLYPKVGPPTSRSTERVPSRGHGSGPPRRGYRAPAGRAEGCEVVAGPWEGLSASPVRKAYKRVIDVT